MSLDGKILHNARVRFEKARQLRELEQARRFELACSKNPRIREIDSELRATVIDALGHAFTHGADPTVAIAEISEDNLYLQSELREELMAAGFPADYLDDNYACPKCRDTGRIGDEYCSCFMDIYRDEQRKELSSLLKLGTETFDTFDLEWYSDVPDPKTGVSPRDSMSMIYDMCVGYARNFGKNSFNLFFCGGTGLGKTFLSTCIAKVVSESGFSVVYETAPSLFSKFEDEKFSRSGDLDEVKSDIHRYLSCDLLIIDDLGTEFSSAFVTSALYNLVNTRLTSGKKTIINSNLSINEICSRYSPQIASRLSGEYQVLPFCGQDIRLLKKERL